MKKLIIAVLAVAAIAGVSITNTNVQATASSLSQKHSITESVQTGNAFVDNYNHSTHHVSLY